MLEQIARALAEDIKPDVPNQWAPGVTVSLLPDGKWYASITVFSGVAHKRTVVAKALALSLDNALNELAAAYNTYCQQAGIS